MMCWRGTVTKYEQGQMKLGEYENKIIMLTTEIQCLNQILKGKRRFKTPLWRIGLPLPKPERETRRKGQNLNIEIEKLKSKIRTSEAAKALENNHLKIKIDDFK